MIFGIDVSAWQEGYNFQKAKAEGVKFAILRGAYALKKDYCFETFYKNCVNAGLSVGVYHYSMATTEAGAVAEANFLINNVLKGKKFDYPIYMDVEDPVQRNLGKGALTKIVIAFCKTLENAGYYTGIYSSASFFSYYMDESQLTNYDKWVANWATKCCYTKPYGMWQFGGNTNLLRNTKVAGVVTDQNYALKDYPTLIKNAGLNGYPKTADSTSPTPAPIKKTVDELAGEVLEGKWGNGLDRKARLEAQGYNYDNVQAKVNQLLNSKKSNYAVAIEVVQGKWGNGTERRRRLESAGYNYSDIQKIVNTIIR